MVWIWPGSFVKIAVYDDNKEHGYSIKIKEDGTKEEGNYNISENYKKSDKEGLWKYTDHDGITFKEHELA